MDLDNKILSKYEISILNKKEVKIEKTKLYTLSFLFFIFALALLSPLFFPELLKFSLEKDESSYSLSIYMFYGYLRCVLRDYNKCMGGKKGKKGKK